MKKKHNLAVLLIIICIILLSVVLVSVYRQYKLDTYLQYKKLPVFDKTLVTEWLDALKTDNPMKALFIASKMVPRSSPYVPFPYYYDMAIQSGINSRFFNPPFTMLDYLYWKDAYDIHQIVKAAPNDLSSKNIPKHFFDVISKDIKLIKHRKSLQRSAFFFEIWQRKQCDILNKYLLFSETMLQAGYSVQIVVLFSDVKKPPVHIIAEIRDDSDNELVHCCDFFTGNFWNKSVRELAANKNLLKTTWKQEWAKGLDHLLFKTEISAMSYRKINQQLHEYLAKDKNGDIPIIGLDPYKRMEEYKRNFYPNHSNNSKLTFILGIEPFTMIKNSKSFPKSWIVYDKTSI
jgi:hypothetical protein